MRVPRPPGSAATLRSGGRGRIGQGIPGSGLRPFPDALSLEPCAPSAYLSSQGTSLQPGPAMKAIGRTPSGPPILLTALLALAPCAAGQGLSLSWSHGVLGDTLDFELGGATPGTIYGLLPSFEEGPTCLPPAFGGSCLDVGIDLFSLVSIGVVPAGGAVQVAYPLPAAPAVAGQTLFAQAATLPGPPAIPPATSNRISFVLSGPDQSHPPVVDMAKGRSQHTLTPLANGLLLALGGRTSAPPAAVHDDWELFDPQTQSWSTGSGSLPAKRFLHSATALQDGRVLIAGGLSPGAGVQDSALLYDPVADAVSATDSMAAARVLHTAVRLPDGRVFVAGGSSAYTAAHPLGYPGSFGGAGILASTEIYDPDTDTWSAGPLLPEPRTGHQATLLGNGKVLISGGVIQPTQGLPISTPSALVYDPDAGTLTPTATSLASAAAFHAQIATSTGGALATGGVVIVEVAGVQDLQMEPHTSIFDSRGGGWISGPAPSEIRTCSELQCIKELGPIPIPPVYYSMGGVDSVSLTSTSSSFSPIVYKIDGDFTAWTMALTLSSERPGYRTAVLDDCRIVDTGDEWLCPPFCFGGDSEIIVGDSAP